MRFDTFFAKKGEKITGHGHDAVGEFHIEGKKIKDENEISFTKNYVGQHSVEYSGRLESKNVITGQWKVGGYSGGFKLTKEGK